jgi:E3 ubiquitin-protein ligase synoviolin
MAKLFQAVFFGQLRVIEVEHLCEKVWFTISETCLAMTVFKDEFDTRFLVHFTLLLFFKSFHWILSDRVDFMEQSPTLPKWFYLRSLSLMVLLGTFDLLFLWSSAVESFNAPSMMIMFTFEYSILSAVLLSLFVKFIIHHIDRQSEQTWDAKSMHLFYLDLGLDFVKLIGYLGFFGYITTFYGLPIHIIRDLYITTRSFITRVKDLIQYIRATSNMNERYPDVSEEELSRIDKCCIICREDMDAQSPDNRPKKLPCSHVFHFRCLRSWLERQQTCPTCRQNVFEGDQNTNTGTQRFQDNNMNNGAAPPPPPQPAPTPAAAAPPPPSTPPQQQQERQQQQPLNNNTAPRRFSSNQNLPEQQQQQQQRQEILGTNALRELLQSLNPNPIINQNPVVPNDFPVQLIPLFPPGTQPPAGEHPLISLFPPSGTRQQLIDPFTDLDSLSEEQLRELQEKGKEGLKKRIRMLSELESKISNAVLKLSEHLSVLEYQESSSSSRDNAADVSTAE